jgi:hypothetical protein
MPSVVAQNEGEAMPRDKHVDGWKRKRRAAISQQIAPASPWGDLIDLVLLLPLATLILVEALRRL